MTNKLPETGLPLADTGIPMPDKVPARPFLTRKRVTFALAALACAGSAIYFGPGLVSKMSGGSEKAMTASELTVAGSVPAEAPAKVSALGRLLPNGGTISVALPTAAGDATVTRLLVAEGDKVKPGQVIAELDNQASLRARVTSAKAALAVAEATLDQVRSQTQLSLAEAKAGNSAAVAALAQAEKERDRVADLAARDLNPRVQLETAELAVATAVAVVERSSAQTDRFTGADDDTQSDIQLAARNVELARSDLASAMEDQAGAKVVAPQAGTVLAIHVSVGEKPGDLGVLTLGDIDHMTAELEVYQTDRGRIAPGQPVTMTAPPLDAPLTGKVTKVGIIVERQAIRSSDPAANADARVIRVTVELDESSSHRASAYTNLDVIGTVQVASE